MSEAEFTRQVLQLAKLRGWRTLHIRPARTAKGWRTPVQGDGVGFPDLVLVRWARLLFVELKSERGKTTAEQEAWLSAIREVDAHSFGVEVYVWRPSDWAMIEWKLA